MRFILGGKKLTFILLGVVGLVVLSAGVGCEDIPDVPLVSTVPAELRWGRISFYAENPLESRAARATQQFTTEQTEVFVSFDFAGMTDGVSWGYRWYVNEAEDEAYSRTGLRWDIGVTGTQVINIYNEAGLEPGAYRLEMYVAGTMVREGNFTVINAGWALYAHPQQGFQVMFPTVWDYAENVEGTVFYPREEITASAKEVTTATLEIGDSLWDTSQPAGGDRPMAFVVAAIAVGQEASQRHAAEVVTEVVTRWRQEYPDMQTTEQEPFTLYDWQGATQDFLYVTEGEAARYGAVLALPVDQRIYVISFWAPAEEYDAVLARYFNPMLRSLQTGAQLAQTFGVVSPGWQAYTHTAPHFGLHYPESWQYVEDQRGVVFMPAEDVGTTVFAVFTNPVEQGMNEAQVLDFVQQIMTRITAAYSDVTTTEAEKAELVRRRGIQQSYLYTDVNGVKFGGTIIAVLAPSAAGGEREQTEWYIYAFLMTARYDDYDALWTEYFSPMLNSFTILGVGE